METALSIGAVAKRAGVRVDTVRYYERRGVLPRAERRRSGYRAFRPQAVERIVFVKELQALGFSLDEIVELLRLADAGTASCASVRRHAEATLGRIDAKIRALTSTRDRLATVVVGCASGACAQMDEISPRIRLPRV
jgi:DNA-binding transcriptional MerR regulator